MPALPELKNPPKQNSRPPKTDRTATSQVITNIRVPNQRRKNKADFSAMGFDDYSDINSAKKEEQFALNPIKINQSNIDVKGNKV